MRLRVKVWLERDTGKVFGDGPADLLRRVERTGSLRAAAAEIGMSYSQAWRLLRNLGEKLGFELLSAQVGGPSGGASQLTEAARRWVEAWEAFRAESQVAIVEAFGRHLKAIVGECEIVEPGRRRADSRVPPR